jgi:hypothetical protein
MLQVASCRFGMPHLEVFSLQLATFNLFYVLYFFGYALFVRAPSRIHAIGTSLENSLNPGDFAFFNSKQLGYLSGPIDI